MQWWYAQLIGYGFSVFAEAILVKNLVETLWDCLTPGSASNPQARPHPWQGEALARIEGVLYVAFLQLGLGPLIGLWLVLKVAGQWKRWLDDGDEKTERPDGRAVFNVFMIGNALTILYSIVGFKMIGWVAAGEMRRVLIVSLAAIAMTLVLWVWIPGQRKSRLG
jgi:hypothetical protein